MFFALPSTFRACALAALCVFPATAGLAQPSAPTLDQRALKVLAEARDLVAAGRSAESIPFYGHALDLVEARRDEPTVALGNLMVEYGEVLTRAGLLDRARVSLDRGLAVLEHFDETPPEDLAIAVSALADLDRESGRFDAAEQGYERSLRLLRGAGATAEALDLQVRLGLVDEESQRLDAAFEHYRGAVLTAREAQVETPAVATALHRGAAILYRQGETDLAVHYFRQALDAARRQYGTGHWQTAAVSKNLALAFDRAGEPGDARAAADDAARILGRACAPGSQSPHEVRDLCAEVSKLRARLADAPSSAPPPAEPTVTGPIATAPPPAPPPPVRPPPPAPARASWATQVSSQRSPAEAERVAEQLRQRFPSLRSQPLRIVRAELSSGVWHRVAFGAFGNRDGAMALCESLKRSGLEACLPVRAEGE